MTLSIKINWYKCFRWKTYNGFDSILPINVIIWKNNSWKSSLSDIIEIFVDPAKLVNSRATLQIEAELTDQILGDLWTWDSPRVNWIYDGNKYLKTLVWKKVSFFRSWKHAIADPKVEWAHEETFLAYQYHQKIAIKVSDHIPLSNKTIRRVNAERDIVPELVKGNSAEWLNWNWEFCTQLLWELFHSDRLWKITNLSELGKLKETFFSELNEIIQPDINFVDIDVKNLSEIGKMEIYFKTEDKNLIPLSAMWSWMKTIILVLVNLILKPKIDSKDESKYIFILEELENNLHPSMQRRLYEYIKTYSEKYTGCYFFITTHSNIVIDSFWNYEKSQIIHVKNNGDTPELNVLLNSVWQKKVLEELDFRASDILQTNWIIWVEWPSDRIYLNKWLSLRYPKLKEWIHYIIMFYGGRLLSHLSFKDASEWIVDNFIQLLKINQNAYVMIDKDGKWITDKLNATKARIELELWIWKVWITSGIEIENYLSNKTLHNWLRGTYAINDKIELKKTDKINDILPVKIKYASDKVKYASEIINYLEISDINENSILGEKIHEIAELVWVWNKIEIN